MLRSAFISIVILVLALCTVQQAAALPKAKVCPSFSIDEDVIFPAPTTPYSLSPCTDYEIVYQLCIPGGPINEHITIDLPAGITYVSWGAYNPAGATVVNTAGGTSPEFDLTGWGSSTPATFTITVHTPSVCMSSVGGLTVVSGPTVGSGSPDFSLQINPPVLFATNAFSGTQLLNTGDVTETVFRLENTSTNGAGIPFIDLNFTLPDPTDSMYHNYYISTSPAAVLANLYTYPSAMPSPLPGVVSAYHGFSGSVIHLDGSDFAEFCGGSTVLTQGQVIYVHIPFKAKVCGSDTGGRCAVSWGCGGPPCSLVNITFNSTVQNGTPLMQVTGFPDFPDGTFCSALSPNTATIGFTYTNMGTPAPSPIPAGASRAAGIKLVLYSAMSFGTLNTNSFQLTYGTNTLSLAGFPVATGTVMFDELYETYTIDLSDLHATLVGWAPLGTGNTLADLNGDGSVDDLAEGGTFTITADLQYNTASCPLFVSCGTSRKNMPYIKAFYNDQCDTVPPVITPANGYGDGHYYYGASGGSASISAPADVVEGSPFYIDLCTAPYYEQWAPVSFDFNCPNGYHQIKLNLPLGYHLNPAALIGPVSGIYQLNHSVTASSSGCSSSLPVNIVPTLQEICGAGPTDPSYVIIKFGGQLPVGNCSGYYNQTYMLDCIDSIPLLLDCPGTGGLCPTLPANFGVDNLSFDLEYICDSSCISCVSAITCGNTSTYHHCNGDCDSYFNTLPNSFTFVRANRGTNNPGPAGNCSLGSILTDPTVIDTLAAYPGDSIVVNLKGQFIPDPQTLAQHYGPDFQEIRMQVRYDDLPSGVRATYDLFDFAGGEVVITNTVTPATYTATVTYTPFLNSMGIVEMNFALDAGALGAMNDPLVPEYNLDAVLYLKAKATPAVSGYFTTFYAGNASYPLTQLRAEFMGLLPTPDPADPDTIYSCDSWGTHFTMLQPKEAATYYPGNGFNQISTCDPYPVQFMFESMGARFSHLQDDFPYEYRPYARLDSVVEITLPPGYTHISSTFAILQPDYNSGGNGFGSSPPSITGHSYPISGMTFSSSAAGTVIRYSGISGSGSCWPLLDDKYSAYFPFHSIVVLMQPSCTAPDTAHFRFTGSYTEGIQQPDTAYQVRTHFDLNSVLPVYHVNPVVTLPPTSQVEAYSNQVTFTFNLCDAIANANHPWIAIENSLLDALDLSTATFTQTYPGTVTYVPYFYTDVNGHTALLFNLNSIPLTDSCHVFTLTATVNSNGCIPTGSSPELDHLTITYGNECSGDTIELPDSSCIQGTTVFYFQRYPSNIEMDLTVSPSSAVDLCDGILHYEFEIESSDLGTITAPDFLVDLPAGISFVDVSFTYPYDNPSPTVLPVPDATLPTGELLWNIEQHVTLPNLDELPGTSSDADSTKIKVILALQTSCAYNATDYIDFYAGGISSCSDSLLTPAIQNRPDINDAEPYDNLSVQVTMSTSDSDPGLNCSNTATFTVTVNTAGTNAHDELLTVTVPGAPLTVSNAGLFTLSGSTLTHLFPIGTLPNGASTYTFEVMLGNNVYCQTHLPVAAVIGFNETVDCTESGGSCNVSYSSEPDSLFIDACCPCTIDLGPDLAICEEGSANLDASTGGGIGYAWSPATGLSCTSCPNPTATPASTTTYTVTVTTPAGYCMDMITITVHPPPLVTVNSATVCAGQSASLTAGGAVTYTWTPAATLSSSTGSPVTATPSSTTIYTITGTDANGCNGSATSTVTVNPLPVVTIGSNSPVCAGATLNLTSSGGSTYAWSGPGGFASSLQNPSITSVTAGAAGTYTVTATDANGCVNSATTSVVVNPLPVVTTGSNSPVCAGATLNLTSSGGGTYAWTGPAGFTSTLQNPSITGVTTGATGTYTVTVTSAAGCVSSATTAVLVNPAPTLTVTTDTDSICKGVSAHLHVSGASTYTWTPSTGLSCINCTDPVASPASTITYTVMGTSALGCTGSATMLITVFTPTISLTPLTASICVGDNVTLNAFGSLVTSYEWYSLPPPVLIGAGTSYTVSGASPGTFMYQVVGYTNILGCKAAKTATVTVHALPAITATPSATICPGVAAHLSASGAGAGGTYSWAPPTGLSCPTCANTDATPASDITYTVTGTDAFGCHNTATSFVHVIPTPTVAISPSSITVCPGTAVSLSASGTGVTTYFWNNVTPPPPDVFMGTGSAITFTPTATSYIQVQGMVSEGCVGLDTVVVTVIGPPVISDCHDISCGQAITLTAMGTGPFTWTPVAGSGATMTDYPATTTTYTVAGACGLTATCLVTVTPLGATGWPKHADVGSVDFNEITDVVQDHPGNTFVIGNYRNTLKIGGITIASSGTKRSCFVAKFSDCGVEWVRNFTSSTTRDVLGQAITVDNNGDVIITGSFSGNLAVNPVMPGYLSGPLSAGLTRKAYVIRLNRNTGETMENIQNGGTAITSMVVEASGITYKNGYVYVSGVANTGILFSPVSPNTTVSIPTNDFDVFVGKFDANLNAIWLRKFGFVSNTNMDGPETEVGVDNSDNVYVGTSIFSNVSFNMVSYGNGAATKKGFVARYNNSGTETYGFAFKNSTDSIKINDLVVDANGIPYVTGSWKGDIQGPSGTLLASSYDRDIFMARLNNSGLTFGASPAWLKRAIGFGTDDGRGVSLDNSGNVYFTGRITLPWSFEGMTSPSSISNGGEAFVCQRVASSGAAGTYVTISKTTPTGLSNLAIGNAINSNGNGTQVVFGGSYTIPSGPNELFNSPAISTTNPGGAAFFAARTNASGTFYRLIDSVEEGETRAIDKGPLQLFPNPNNGLFMLQFKDHALSKARIEVYDGQGKKVLTETTPIADDQVELNLKGISEGVYMVMVWQDGEIYSKRVVIMK
jgi:hypothetical protein